MRQSVTMRLDPGVLKAARRKATADNRTLTNYVETLLRRDLQAGPREPTLRVVAPSNIRESTPVPIPGESPARRKRREQVFRAVIKAGGYG
jgi:hypothetical protein